MELGPIGDRPWWHWVPQRVSAGRPSKMQGTAVQIRVALQKLGKGPHGRQMQHQGIVQDDCILHEGQQCTALFLAAVRLVKVIIVPWIISVCSKKGAVLLLTYASLEAAITGELRL